jgi:hypothetical protein
VLKIVLAGIAGSLTFIGLTLLDELFELSLAERLTISFLVAGIVLLTQFLVDFGARLHQVQIEIGHRLDRVELEVGQRLDQVEVDVNRRLDLTEARQTVNAADARRDMNLAFERISEATRFFMLIEQSALRTGALTELVEHFGRINGANPQLVQDLAHHEIDRLSQLLKTLSDGDEVFYDGEDREWLLGLASHASSSIMATSLATVDAGDHGFEGGLWMSDLGARYLQIQRAAVQRGVQIRRIFVFDRPGFAADADFTRVRYRQREAGIQVRVLENHLIPEHLRTRIFDFILFDDVISYETSPIQAAANPAILTTRLILHEERVRRLALRFEELWSLALEVD